jgi:ketosteroid isomerase-like protein
MLRVIPALVGSAFLMLPAGRLHARPQQSGPDATPQQVVEELLAADRDFARRSARTDLVTGLSAMFANEVAMRVPGPAFARGKAAATAELKRNSENAQARVEWAPVRGGISADGQHGFTFGYMTVRNADGTAVPGKYVAYWVKGPAGWRVAVYKRVRSNAAPSSPVVMPPALPARLVPVSTDTAAIARHRESLAAAERAFSAEAQKIGLSAAFAKYGHADAVNVGSPTDAEFVNGAEAIGRAVSGGSTSTDPGISWGPDDAIVASSGDLGVTMGMIRWSRPGPDGKTPAPVQFITVWRRDTTADPWRYIAE